MSLNMTTTQLRFLLVLVIGTDHLQYLKEKSDITHDKQKRRDQRTIMSGPGDEVLQQKKIRVTKIF